MHFAVLWMRSSQKKGRDFELEYWRVIVRAASSNSDDLAASSWADTLLRYHIPCHYALQLIDGVVRDLTQSRYQIFDDLATYCYIVATTVGLMSMYIVGFKSQKEIPYAIQQGVALQMTNNLREVGEDYRNSRLYPPREEFAFYGIRKQDIFVGRIIDNWRQFMKFRIGRTRQPYTELWAFVNMLEWEGQVAAGAASTLYSGI